MSLVKEYDYPVCFDFPAGHIPDNCSLIFGQFINLSVAGNGVNIDFFIVLQVMVVDFK